jgi:hypothetical protein
MFTGPKTIFRIIAVSAVTIVIFWVIFMKIDFDSVMGVLSNSNPFWLVNAFCISLFSITITAKRWQMLLGIMGCNLRYRESFNTVIGALPLSSITPSKSGDVIKAYYLKSKILASKTIGAVITERAFDVLFLILLSLIGAISFGRYGLAGIMAITLTCIGIIFFIIHKGFNFPLKKSWGGRLKNLVYSMKVLTHNRRTFIAIATYSLLIWFLAIMQVIVFFLALGINIPLLFAVANVPVAIFVGMVPITLGGMGTRDAAIVFLFSGFATPERLLGVGILYSVFRYWSPSLLGVPFMYKMLRKST